MLSCCKQPTNTETPVRLPFLSIWIWFGYLGRNGIHHHIHCLFTRYVILQWMGVILSNEHLSQDECISKKLLEKRSWWKFADLICLKPNLLMCCHCILLFEKVEIIFVLLLLLFLNMCECKKSWTMIFHNSLKYWQQLSSWLESLYLSSFHTIQCESKLLTTT